MLGERDPRTLVSRCRLGLALLQVRPEEAERHLVPAMEGLIAAKGRGDPESLIAMQGVGALAIRQGKAAGADDLLRQSVEGLRASRGPAHPETLDATTDLAVALRAQGKREEAARLVAESIRIVAERLGDEHPAALDAKAQLEPLFAYMGDLPASIRMMEELLPAQRRVLGDGHSSTLLTRTLLGQYYQMTHRVDEATSLLSQALPDCRKDPDRNDAILSLALGELAACYLVKKDVEKARPCLLEARDITWKLHGPDHGFTDAGNRVVADLYLFTREQAAERYLRDHLAYINRQGPESAERYLTEAKIGLCLLYRKARAEGEALLQRFDEWVTTHIQELTPAALGDFKSFETHVIRFYEGAGDTGRAELWKGRRMDLGFPADSDGGFTPSK